MRGGNGVNESVNLGKWSGDERGGGVSMSGWNGEKGGGSGRRIWRESVEGMNRDKGEGRQG